MKKIDDPQLFCLKYGVKVYPIYQRINVYVKGKLKFEKNNWYIEVNNNGVITTFKKSICVGMRISGKIFEGPIRKTYKHFMNQIKLQNGKK